MKILVDAQIPPSLCGWLQSEFGVECIPYRAAGFEGSTDLDVFNACRKSGWVILSKDEDFVDLVTRLGPPPQVLWLRIGNATNRSLQTRLVNSFPIALEHLRRGEVVVELGGAATSGE